MIRRVDSSMMHMAVAVCVCGVALGVTLPAAGDFEQALADHEDALTKQAVDAAGRQMWEQVVRVPHREGPAEHADHPLHEEADALLAEVAYRLTDARNAPEWAELERVAGILLDAGYDSPHLHGWYAHALAVRGDMAGAEPHAEQAADALLADEGPRLNDDAEVDGASRDSDVPLFLQAITAQRLAWIYGAREGRAADAEQYRQRAAHLYVRALADELPDAALGQRAMVQWVREDSFDQLTHEDQQTFYQRCRDHNVDRWVTHLLGGIVKLRIAEQITQVHGVGPLPLEQGATYHRSLTDARRYLNTAYQKHPDRPEPAAWLISLTARGYAPAGTTHYDWFRRAVDAQIDYLPAYTRMMDALHPHRLGSRDELLEFGVSCLMTERFDTEVPYQFFHAVRRYAGLLGGDFAGAFEQEDVAEQLLWMLERYRARPDRQDERAWFDSFIAAVAWRSGDVWLAGEAMADAGDSLDAEVFERVGAMPQRAIGEIHARTGARGRVTRQLEAMAEDGNHEVAMAELNDLVRRHAGQPPLQQYYAHMAGRVQIRRNLSRGEEAIGPTDRLGGWSPMVGQWSVDEDGDLVGQSTEEGLWIICDVPLGTAFELEAEIEFDLDQTSSDPPNAGIFFGHRSGEGFHTFLADQQSRSATLNRGLWGGKRANAPVEEVTRIRIVVRDRRVYGVINGRHVFSHESVRDFKDDERARIGLGGQYTSDGAVVRFRNIRARQIRSDRVSELPGLTPGVVVRWDGSEFDPIAR